MKWPSVLALLLVISCLLVLSANAICQSGSNEGIFSSWQSFAQRSRYIRHKNFLTYGETVQSGGPFTSDATWKMVPGIAGCGFSFESVNFPGFYLRHRDFIIRLEKNDGSSLFALDATWRVKPGLANNRWNSFESVNFPNYYLIEAVRGNNFQLFLRQFASTTSFARRATWRATASFLTM